LNTTPTALKTLRKVPEQLGHTVRASSENACWMSNAWPQSLQE